MTTTMALQRLCLLLSFAISLGIVSSENASYSCHPVPEMCKGAFKTMPNYTQSRIPNYFGHKKYSDSLMEVHQFYPLIKIQCSPVLQDFLCSLYHPPCGKYLIPPCRSTCEQVKISCNPIMNRFGFEWPASFRCNRFPYPIRACYDFTKGTTTPRYSQTTPLYSRTTPTYAHTTPYPRTTPKYYYTTPRYNRTTLRYGRTTRRYYYTTPRYYRRTPRYGQTTRSYYYTTPRYGRTTRRYYHTTPKYYRTTPRYGWTTRRYYYTTPRYYRRTPRYGRTTRRYYYTTPSYYRTTKRYGRRTRRYYYTTPRYYRRTPWYARRTRRYYYTTPRYYRRTPWYARRTRRYYHTTPSYYRTTPRYFHMTTRPPLSTTFRNEQCSPRELNKSREKLRSLIQYSWRYRKCRLRLINDLYGRNAGPTTRPTGLSGGNYRLRRIEMLINEMSSQIKILTKQRKAQSLLVAVKRLLKTIE